MAISSRGEMGVGGGSRGGFGGGGRSAKPKKLAEPKSAVKVVPKGSAAQNAIKNNIATANAQRAKSGLEASYSARQVMTGRPNATVKIGSGPRANRTRSGQKAAPAKRATGRK